MSTFPVVCTCGKKLRAPLAQQGKKCQCPSCGTVFCLPRTELGSTADSQFHPASKSPSPMPQHSLPPPLQASASYRIELPPVKVPMEGNKVWAIDLRDGVLKALGCRLLGGVVRIEDVEYIEYEAARSPQADPDAAIQKAVNQLRKRHDLRAARVGLVYPSSSTILRFLKLPPLDQKSVPKIVQYEAKQHFPVPLAEMAWTYHELSSSRNSADPRPAREIVLVGGKLDELRRRCATLQSAGIPVDVIQASPLCLGALASCVLPADGVRSATNSTINATVVLSIGDAASELVIYHPPKLWPQQVPLGGQHFGKQPNAQANSAVQKWLQDFRLELSRSKTFFHAMDRHAVLKHLLVLGGASELPGITESFCQELQCETVSQNTVWQAVDTRAVQSQVWGQQRLALGDCLGLVLQLLMESPFRTNLLPQELQRGLGPRLKTACTKLSQNAATFSAGMKRLAARLAPKPTPRMVRPLAQPPNVASPGNSVSPGPVAVSAGHSAGTGKKQSPHWQCPKCGGINAKKSTLMTMVELGSIIDGSNNCGHCGTLYSQRQVYGGVYDTQPPASGSGSWPSLACTLCTQPLERLNHDSWLGTVCPGCRGVYCARCRPPDPGPCPRCGQRCSPAMSHYLR